MTRGARFHAVLLGRPVKYDGTQIGPLWAYREHGIQGDGLLAFVGPCAVPKRHMIDQEDVRRNARIAGPRMLHFIAEHFDRDLEKAVLRQRLMAAIVQDQLGGAATRLGDDLFVGSGKLSISIATLTAVSSKIHFGVNIERATDVGVETRALRDLGVDPAAFAQTVLVRYAREMDEVDDARTRVRGVP